MEYEYVRRREDSKLKENETKRKKERKKRTEKKHQKYISDQAITNCRAKNSSIFAMKILHARRRAR